MTVKIVCDRVRLVATTMGEITIGRTWRRTNRNSLTPTLRAASTWSHCFTLSTGPRTTLRHGRRVHDGDGEDQVRHGRSQGRDDRNREQENREGENHIEDAHDDVVHHAAEIAGESPRTRPAASAINTAMMVISKVVRRRRSAG